MDEKPHVGIVVKCLGHEIGRSVASVVSNQLGDAATGVQSWVLRYLYDHRDKEVFQKDLETKFSVRRSTMTTILKLMEKNGMIEKESVSRDARLKRLIITPSAVQLQEKIRSDIDELEEKMISGITEDELKMFFATAEKIKANLRR